MNTMTTDNISARLEKLRAKASTGFKMQVSKIYSSAEHPAFIPDSMVSEAVRVAEESASQFLRKAVFGVSAISEAPEGFLLVHDSVAAHLRDLERTIEKGRGVRLSPDTLKVINERFKAVSQRAYENLENYRASFSGSKNKGGRPQKWDWEGALIYLVAVANTPDGLPTGQKAQAEIEKIIGDWFDPKADNTPVESEIRKRASAVMQAISNLKKAGN